MILLSSLPASLSGIVVGLTGVGGGSLMTPILIFFFGVKPYLAVGTDLLFAAFTKMGGTVSLARQRLVPWRVVAHLCAGSIPAALLTLYVLHTVGPADPAVQRVMTSTLGVALLLTAAATLFKAVRGKHAHRARCRTANWPRPCGRATGALPLLFGAVIGTLVTLTSVGAGAIGVTVLLILYPLLPLPRIVGSRHRLCRAADPGGRPGPRLAGLGRLAAAGQAAGRLTTRHLGRLTPDVQDTRARDPLPAVAAAGLRRYQADRPLSFSPY
jgi:uncharacterized membrane protein YfcA